MEPRFLLDTNVVLYYLKYSSDPTAKSRLDALHRLTRPFDAGHVALISVVTRGELLAIAQRNAWGKAKTDALLRVLDELVTVDVTQALLPAYAELDAYSQGRHATLPLAMSSRNMGKNDLWIAATAVVTGSTLLTADGDFDHLSPAFLRLHKV